MDGRLQVNVLRLLLLLDGNTHHFLFCFTTCRSFPQQGDAVSWHAALASGNSLQRQQPLLQESDTWRVSRRRRKLQRLHVSLQAFDSFYFKALTQTDTNHNCERLVSLQNFSSVFRLQEDSPVQSE